MADLAKRKKLTVAALVGVLGGMVALTVAAVPLYQWFCRVTGYGGTTQVADTPPPAAISDRVITVRFNADVGSHMPWRFEPAQIAADVHVGEVGIAYYSAENPTDETVVGSATYNVTPHKAGPYFSKIACFCFDEQRLAAGERAEMPVSFFIDPAILDHAGLDDVTTITLSYTFFRVTGGERPVAETRRQGEPAGPSVN